VSTLIDELYAAYDRADINSYQLTLDALERLEMGASTLVEPPAGQPPEQAVGVRKTPAAQLFAFGGVTGIAFASLVALAY
jgi:hypothetical protein